MTVRSTLAIARRFLFGRPGTPGLSRRVRGGIVGVGLSLIPLVVVLQVADGMIAGITSRFIEAGSSHIQAVARLDVEPEQAAGRLRRAAAIDGITLATAERQGIGLAAAGDSRAAVTIRAVEPDLLFRDPGLQQYLRIESGEWDLSDSGSIVLGRQVATQLGVVPGDAVRVLTARPLAGGRFLPRSSNFVVKGIVSTGYADLDRLWAFIAYSRGQAILPAESSRLLLQFKVEQPLALPNPLFRSRAAALERGEQLVGAVREALGSEYRVATWFEADRAQYMSFQTTKDLLVFIMVLIVLVAAVNISSTLVMLVLEKQEEIAVLKSLGASPEGVRTAFVFSGFVLGLIGTVVGIGLGLLIAVHINEVLYAIEWLINAGGAVLVWLASPFRELAGPNVQLLSGGFYLEQIPITIRLRDLLLVSFLSLLLSTAAAYFPARRAGRVRPLEVLRRH